MIDALDGNPARAFRHYGLPRANALTGHRIGLEETDNGIWSIFFNTVLLAKLDERDCIIRCSRPRIGVNTEDLESRLQQIVEVPTGPASSIQNAHPRRDSTAQQLVEQIDVDCVEPGLKLDHTYSLMMNARVVE